MSGCLNANSLYSKNSRDYQYRAPARAVLNQQGAEVRHRNVTERSEAKRRAAVTPPKCKLTICKRTFNIHHSSFSKQDSLPRRPAWPIPTHNLVRRTPRPVVPPGDLYMLITRQNYQPASNGEHAAVLADIVDLGTQVSQFGPKHRLKCVFITEEKDDEGEPIR